MRKLLAIIALLCAFALPAAAVDFPQLDGRVIDEARLLSDGAKRALENKLANLEAHASRQLIVVTLASARGMTVDEYGLALRKQWGLEVNGKRVMLIVGSREGRSVIQYDTSLKGTLGDGVTERILEQTMKPRFNAGDFPGGVVEGANALVDALIRAPAEPAAAPVRVAQEGEIRVPASAEYPALSGRVVDDAGVLDAATRESLRAKLAALEAKTGDQLVVATVKSLNGNSVEEYANRLFRRWQLGQRGKNNGVLLLHAPAERKIRIEVGYGLEGTLTDAITKYIIQNAITPRFKANDFSGGMTRGVDDIIKVLDGGAEEFKQRAAPKQSWNLPPDAIFMAIFALVIITTSMGGLIGPIHALFVWLGWAKKKPKSGFWHWAGSSSSYGGSSDSWSSSSSSGSSWSSGGSSDSFSGGGGDSGGGGSSGDY
jgi:uncharacterized protein